MWLWLAALYAVSVVVQLALGLRVVSPWIMVDELVYSDMARSFAAHGHFLIRGVHGNYGFVYPLLLSPAYALFGSMHDVYQWARVIDALVMSLGGRPGVPARAPRRPSSGRARRRRARRRDPVDGVRRDADDGERVLSDLPLARVRAAAHARAADARAAARRARAVRARVRHARADGRARRRRADGAARARVDRARPAAAARRVQAAVRHRRGAARCSSSSSRSRAAARLRTSSATTAKTIERRLPRLAGAEVARPPRRRARSLRCGSCRSPR